jgi:hypothetical protein
MGWFTVEKISRILRIISLLAAVWSGNQAVQGYNVVRSRTDGIASASAADVEQVGGNAAFAGLLAFVAANKKMIDGLLGTLGVPETATKIIGDVIDAGRMNQLRDSFNKAQSEPERKLIRDAARIVADEIFDENFPPAAGAAK